MKNFIILFMSLQTVLSFSQTTSVRGIVADNEKTPLSYVTVLIFEENASEAFKGATTDENGAFKILDLEPKSYRISFNFIGFKEISKTITLPSEENLGMITLEEIAESLSEAVIVAKTPAITRKVDRLIFNVENTTLSSGTSWDILRRTPGVITIQDNLMIKGQGASVYLNDRKVQISASELKTFLEGFSGTNVQSIEVISNPSSEFDAESGPILNIRTSKHAALGYKGNVNGSLTQSVFPKYTVGTSHFYKNKKLNLYFNYSFNPKKEYKEDVAEINFINNDNVIFSRWENDFNRTTRSQAHNGSVILDYDFDDANSLNLTTNLLHSPNRTFNNNIINESFNAQRELDSTFISKSKLENDLNNIAVDITYKHQLETEGAHISTNLHYTDYDRKRIQNVSTDYFEADNSFIRNFSFFTDAAQDISIYTAQVDYETPLLGSNFSAGIKTSVIDSKSGIDFFTVVNNNQMLDANRSDNYLYDEKVYAAYVNTTKVWEKWNAKIGLRAEQTDASGESVSLEKTNEQNYFELFPSAYLQHIINENHSLSFNYSRGISRPRYEDLNPFAYFLNENNFQLGNPTLQPNISHEFNLNYTLNNKYFFDLYYRDRGRYISRLSFQNNDAQTLRSTQQNIIEAVSYGLDFTHSRSITEFWYFFTYMSVFYETETFLAIESNSVEVTNDITGFFGQFYNNFTLSKNGDLTGEVTFTYWSGFIFGSFDQATNSNLSIGLRQKLWNNRAVITLVGEDILGKANSRMTSRYLNQDYSYLAVAETQFIRFGFTYNFGNFRLDDNQRRIDKAERDRLSSQ